MGLAMPRSRTAAPATQTNHECPDPPSDAKAEHDTGFREVRLLRVGSQRQSVRGVRLPAIRQDQMSQAAKHYAHYLTTTQYFKLDNACRPLWNALPSGAGIYLVGSVLRKPDWRDVDIRAILEDAEFDRFFPVVDKWQENALWKIVCISISNYLSSVTDLPIDFQIQRQSQANQKYSSHDGHHRNAIGLFIHEYDHLPKAQ